MWQLPCLSPETEAQLVFLTGFFLSVSRFPVTGLGLGLEGTLLVPLAFDGLDSVT